MPAPQSLEWRSGRLLLDEHFAITGPGASNARVQAVLPWILGRLRADAGLHEPAAHARRGGAALILELEGEDTRRPPLAFIDDESYQLVVSPREARLKARQPVGLLRGLETFLQLVRREGGRALVPAVAISDRPRFPWRGLLLDPCRHWLPVEVIRRNLDAMAAVKLNVLHWHLSEDQGFRIESRLHPKLHEQGSDGLYYTQDQVRDIVAYAAARGIRVVPELDVPGHTTSWLVGHPELGSAPGPYTIARSWGIFDNALDPTRDETYVFLEQLLGEIAGLFPDPCFHIGGDEVTPRQWNANAAVLDFMYRHDVADASELQARFNQRVHGILAAHGKRMLGWDEILRPELPKTIVVQSWRGAASLTRAARLGYDALLSSGYYLDHMQPAAAHYLVDPLPEDLAPEAQAHVLGGEACMWGEFVDAGTVDSRIWPRAAAVAERLWSPAEVRDVDDMYRRLERQSERLQALGVRHRSNQAAMLGRIAGGASIEALQRLADRVEPVRGRGQARRYTSAMPLDRLVDAAAPESLAARHLERQLDQLLGAPAAERPAHMARLRSELAGWRDNHGVLEPILAASELGAEARPLSKELAALGVLGLQALDAVEAGRAPAAAWLEEAQHVLEGAQTPRAELQLAVVPAVRLLVLAAEEIESLTKLPPAEWAPHLRALLQKPRR
jgi:hexosaminidase